MVLLLILVCGANEGDVISVNFDYTEDNSNIVPTYMNLDIIYEDDWIIAVNKPAGVAVHPSQLHFTDSLSNGIRFYFDKIGLKKKIRPVNRLDFNTSGVVVFAKCEYIHEALSNQMQNNSFHKEYFCIVSGILEKKQGTINLPIARKPNSIIERCISDAGKESITLYEVTKEFVNYSLIHCILKTGRTHQIRVHVKAIGHPIIGDSLYGNKSNLITRQALHSYKIDCIHPITKMPLTLIAKMPKDMEDLL